MQTKYDDEIRELEVRLAREREQLIAHAEDLRESARNAAVSPKGLLCAFGVGFLLGEALRPRRRKHEQPQGESAAATTTKLTIGGTLGGLIGSTVIAFARGQFGNPLVLTRNAWTYAQKIRARRAAVAAKAAREAGATGSEVQAAAQAAYQAPPEQPMAADSAVLRTLPKRRAYDEHHAAG